MINGIFTKTHRVGSITVIIGSLCIGVSLLFGFLRDAFSELFAAGVVMGIGLCLEGLILVFFNRYAELLVEGGRITLANLSILKNNRAKAVRFSTLEALCKALDCNVGDLLTYLPDEKGNL